MRQQPGADVGNSDLRGECGCGTAVVTSQQNRFRAGECSQFGDGASGCPLTTCGTACVDTKNDPANCGACGTKCPDTQVCSMGACGLTCGARRNAGRQAKACRRLSCRRESGALSNAARAAYLTCHLLLMATLDEPMPWWGWLAALFVVLALTGCAQGITGQAGAPPGDVVTPRTKRRQKARQIRGTRCSARLGLWAQVNVVFVPAKRSMVVDTAGRITVN